jgi:alpha-methylacyl-CoA racemase
VHGLLARGLWSDRRGGNLFDGSAPFYRTYRCADGRFVAVGAIEAHFYAALLEGLGLAAEPLGANQFDAATWPELGARLAEVFATRTRDAWAEHFAGTQACVTPVLSFAEAAEHPHNRARGTFSTAGGLLQPAPAPRFSGTSRQEVPAAPLVGADTREVLLEAGLDPATVDELSPH